MKFDAYAFLEKLNSETGLPAKPAKPAKPEAKTPAEVVPFSSLAGLAATPDLKPETAPAPETSPYGTGIAGGLKTWTGKVVGLETRRNLSDWERHGSTGKQWNGITQQWEPKP